MNGGGRKGQVNDEEGVRRCCRNDVWRGEMPSREML